MSRQIEPVALPHSWDFQTWPTSVFPGSAQRAKHVFRMHRSELLAAGACARVGRVIVFFGAGYSRFLRKGAARVRDFEIAAKGSLKRTRAQHGDTRGRDAGE